jgi:hypothetical protein
MMRRGPGLVRGVARTAVIAGTATAVSGRVARRQQARYEQKQAAAQPEPAYVEQPAAAAPEESDMAQQIQELASLKEQGLLTEEEFAAKKKQILGI